MPVNHHGSAAIVAAALLSFVLGRDASGQLRGHYVPGFTGLQNGSLPPPGISVSLPVYFYTTNEIKGDDGRSLGPHPRIDLWFISPIVTWVTNATILGATYAGSVGPTATYKSRIEGRSLDVSKPFAFTDVFLQPILLGWKAARADYVAGYTLFIPTGRWELNGSHNAGLGVWSHLPQAGTTIHLDTKQRWTFSTLASYEIHSWKHDAPIKIGDLLTFEGGLGRTFVSVAMKDGRPVPTLISNAGVVYYAQFKTTSDKAGVLTPLVAGRKDRVFAAGFEGNVIIPKARMTLGLRVEPEFGARNRPEGWTFVLTAAYELTSFVKSPEPPVLTQPTR